MLMAIEDLKIKETHEFYLIFDYKQQNKIN